MSASQDKKRRVEERGQGTERHQVAAEREAKAARKSRAKWIAGTIVIVLLIAAILIGNSSLFYTMQTAVTIGDESFSPAEVNYYYKTEFFNFCNQNSMLLGGQGKQGILDPQQPLRSQACTLDENFETWHDYFADAAVKALTRVTALCKGAEEAGLTLSEADQKGIDEQMASLEEAAESYGYGSAEKYVTAAYGHGVSTKLVRRLMEQSTLASLYAKSQYDGFTYDDAAVQESIEAHANDDDLFTYQSYLVSAERVESTDAEGNPVNAVTEETMAAARATAEQIAAKSKDEASFRAAVAELGTPVHQHDENGQETGETKPAEAAVSENVSGEQLMTAPFAEWLYDAARTDGEVTTIEAPESGWYVVRFGGRDRNDYALVSVRHILIKAEDTDGDGKYSEEEKAAAKEKMDAVQAEWDAGEKTEDAFAALANAHSEDPGSGTTGGLYENFPKGQMVPEFNDWCYAPERSAGDVGLVYAESPGYAGYHLIYFVGEGPVCRSYLAEQHLRDADYQTWTEEYLADWTAETRRGMRYVG